MKKFFKALFIIIASIIGLLILMVAVMWIFKISPPPGPWPMPPWADDGNNAAVKETTQVIESVLADISAAAETKNQTSEPPYNYVLPDEYQALFSQPEWEQEPSLPADFMMGHAFMDFYNTHYYNNYVDSTLDSMKNSGAEWAIYDNYWSYTSTESPAIGPSPKTTGFRNATHEEILQMAQKAHERGLKFCLMSELNWDVMMTEWRSWEDTAAFWQENQRLLEEKGQNVSENREWWNRWFEAYGAFILDQAAVAEEAGAEMLVIGKQIDGAVQPELEDDWRSLIARVREVYHGLISYASYTNQYFTQAEVFPYDACDYIIIYMYNAISEEQTPSMKELTASFEQFNEDQLEPLSERYGVPTIFLTPFQSRDYGAMQEWFEPGAPAPDIAEDLTIQAMMYEALMQSVQDEGWVAGVWTWGYWWRDDYNTMFKSGDSSFNKSSSVRNKPANVILKKWSDAIS